MKRRLPTTYQGETVWAAISLPPVTAEANRQAPSRPHPGRPAAASDAAPIAASANRPAAEGGVTAAPSSSTASAANATPSSRAPRPEPADPAASGFVRHTRPLRGRAHPADATGDLIDHRADGLGHIQPPGQHERRQQRMAHPARRAPQPGHEDPPAPARLPDITPVPRPEHQRPGTRRAGRPGELHATASRHVGIDRERAGPYDDHGRHRLGSLLAIGAKRGEEGSLTFNGDTTILTRPQQAGKPHRQRAQPGTRPGRSDSQAVNNGKQTLEPLDAFDLGMISGKLSALRWVIGDEWDFLDT